MQWVERQVAAGARITGTPQNKLVGDLILNELSANGWRTESQNFSYKNTQARNLVGKKGDAKNIVILGAHYDTRKYADQDATRPREPVPGANDGASGAAVLLELARVLDTQKLNAQVWLVFFDAEDNGGIDGWDFIAGSSYFAQQLTITPTAVVVLDMIGDAQQDIYLEQNSDAALSKQIWAIAKQLGFEQQFISTPKWSMTDDHTPFLQRGFRAVDVIDFDYAHWHKTSDTPDKVSAQSLERVGRVMQTWLESISN